MTAAKRTVTLCGLAIACLSASVAITPAAAADAAHTWRHGAIEAKSDAGFFYMVKNGFAEKQGLKLDVVQFKTDIIALQALIAGEIDSFEGGPSGSMLGAARGGDFKIIGCNWPGLPYAIFTRPEINSLAELKGKTFAISAPSANPAVVARAILQKYDVAPAQVNFANLGGDLDRFKSVVAGVAAAAIVSNEYEPIAEKQGIKLLVSAGQALPDYVRQCMISSAKTLASKHDDAVRFLAAEMAAWRYAAENRDAELRVTREMTGIKPDDPRPEFVYDDAIRTHAVDPEFAIPVNKLQWMEEQLVKDGNLKQPIDINKVVDASIREQALQLVTVK